MSKKNIRHVSFKTDCVFFYGDRPCDVHKRRRLTCVTCDSYKPFRKKVLIIKLEASGDVLRTTSLLDCIRARFKEPHITWITSPGARELLEHNPFINRLLEYSVDALAVLLTEEFDLFINLDLAPRACRLATLAKAKIKKGFILNKKGVVAPVGKDSQQWYRMSLDDGEKKKNQRTYQDLMLDIIGINGDYTSPVLHLEPEELSWARNFKSEHAIVNDRPIIGIHPGGSARWPKKRWGLTQYVKLITQLKGLGFSIMLFAGPQEISFHEELLRRCGKKVIDAGCNLSMRQFASLVNLVDLMICSDSLALHVATALKKKVVALFGPTSVSEIDLFGRGRKIVSRLACVGCYLNRCEKSPSCMDLITWQSVKKAAQELIFDVKKK